MTDAKQDTNTGLMEAGQFLIDRLKEFESNISDLDDDRAFTGHVLPALARFRAALTGQVAPAARTCPGCGVLEGMECKPACPRRIIAEMDAHALTKGNGDGW